MAQRVQDLLARRVREHFVGRNVERAQLMQTLETDGPLLVYLHGIAGVGKSSLLEAFAADARGQGATVVSMDCRTIEPTDRGFLHALGLAIGNEDKTLQAIADRLSGLAPLVVLTLDTYEVFRFLDTWLREAFIPALGDNVRVVLSGREPPVSAWLASPQWEGLFRSISLEPLAETDALELLGRTGLDEDEARHINRSVHGHPLALKLAAAAMAERPELSIQAEAIPQVVEELTRTYLGDVHDPLTRKALEAASVVRCVTHSLLGAMLPETAPQDAFERLRSLPFVAPGKDGLLVHDAVREALAAHLRTVDPVSYREHRRNAWRQLRAEVRSATVADLWRYTADVLYLLENPAVREAFFPSGGPLFVVHQARQEDGQAILQLAYEHEPGTAAQQLELWWQHAPQSFFAVRDRHDAVAGFHCTFDPTTVDRQLVLQDPVTRAWWEHLQAEPLSSKQRALFVRRWLGAEHGELPSPVQAACWLDIKRSYLSLRPQLRRVYTTVRALEVYAPSVTTLGFHPIGTVDLGDTYHLAVNDFGPDSVDGWLAGLVAAELGIEEQQLLDVDARELVVGRNRVPLTRLEFAVMQYLVMREGKAISRASLIEDVWGYRYDGGSNVVDAVVRSLRKKLGEEARRIETVGGVGYRYRARP